MMEIQPIDIHTPHSHDNHSESIPCGCWLGNPTSIIVCPHCNAAYEASEVLEFPTWICYDCKGSVPHNLE